MLQCNFTPFPDLETQRLRLRRPAERHAPDLFLMRSDAQVMQYIPRPLAKSEEDVLELLRIFDDFIVKNERINWVMEWKETGEAIGMIGFVNIRPEHFRAEVGYSLRREWHRQGIMSEALAEIVAFGFREMQLHSIEAIIDAQNDASGGLLERSGFRKEAHFLEDFFHNGAFRDSIHFGLLRREWESAR